MILDTVLATIRRHAMLRPGDAVVVAVSGGPDSVALLHLLLEAREIFPLSLTVAHLDHALRGSASVDDRAFVEELARRLGLPFVSERIDVAALARREKRSIEEAGRRARRSFLRDAAARAGARRVALGHHLDDQAESVLLRLIAGAGRGGLAGIRPVSERLFVRPLIGCTRSEILAWLEERRIPYRSDASNNDPRFPRNRLRQRVLPLLKEEFNPRVVQAIARTAALLRDEDRFLEREARQALEGLLLPPETGGRANLVARTRPTGSTAVERAMPAGASERNSCLPSSTLASEPIGPASAGRSDTSTGAGTVPIREARPVLLDATRLGELPPPIARRAVRLALRRAGLSGRDLAAGRIDEILRLASRRGSNASLSIGAGLEARVEYGRLRIGPQAPATIFNAPAGISDVAAGDLCEPGALAVSSSSEPSPGAGSRSDPSTRRPAAVLAEGRRSGERPDLERIEPDRRGLEDRAPDGSSRLDLPGTLAVPTAGLTIHARRIARPALETAFRRAPPMCAYLDAAGIASPLAVRPPRPGDRYQPLGSPGSRKLSDLWTDAKLPREVRQRCLVVESGAEIVWVVGMRPSEAAKVTDSTRDIVLLEALPSDGILYAAAEIAAAVDSLARRVAGWAGGREIVVLGVLQGSFMFLADLARRLPDPVRVGFLDREGSPLGGPLEIRDERVLLVEDILDTGRSLARVLERVRSAGPAEIRTCVLFDKPAGRKIAIEADFAGLLVPDRWVVGYGLDQEGRHRNLPWLTWVPEGPGSDPCKNGGSDVE